MKIYQLKKNAQTIGVDLSTKVTEIGDGARVTLQIWDTGGQGYLNIG